ncbi:MAG: M28 family peptidase [Oligoflexia bacterium]|nr:M28 family peptidase [Oligoflexia bacterium]
MKLFQKLIELGEKKIGTSASREAQNLIINHVKQKITSSVAQTENFNVSITSNQKSQIKNSKDEIIDSYLYDNTGTKGVSITAPMYYIGYGIKKINKNKAKGKILVFVYNFFVHRIYQVYKAYNAGATAVILISNNRSYIQRGIGYPSTYDHCPIPVVGINQEHWDKIKNEKKITIDYSCSIENVLGTNVIFDFPSRANTESSVDKKIVIAAHYDSWHAGAHDNCIANQLLVDLLDNLIDKKDGKSKLLYSIRAIFFDGEETGLLGSKFHSEHNNLDRYSLYLNLEMPIPSKKGSFRTFFYSHHKELRRSFTVSFLLKNFFLPIPLRLYYKLIPFFPGDMDFFYKKNIPSISTFCSNPYYHTIKDTSDCIDFDQYDWVLNFLLKTIKIFDGFQFKSN